MMTRGRFSLGRSAGLAAAVALALWQWNAAWLFPLRVLMTLTHEFGHGLAALLTGGVIDRITVDPGLGGVCFTRGGWRWLILSSGYLGSMAAGCGVILLACRTRHEKSISLALGVFVMLATLFYVRTLLGFSFGLLTGAALASAGWWLSEDLNDSILCFLGTMSCLSAVIGLKELASYGGNNDALMFSREVFPLPAFVWALLWAGLSLACLAATLKAALRTD
jgi:hypothetical protein